MKSKNSYLLSEESDEFIKLNAKSKIFTKDGENFKYDKEAARIYIKEHVDKNMLKFKSTKERFEYMIKNDYYEKEILDNYKENEIADICKIAKEYNFEFPSFMGALKFFNSYALKSFDGSKYLESYEDRVVMNALYFGGGNIEKAKKIMNEIMLGRFQPATPTFLNAGKKQRGEYISCYLLRVEDNMESICRSISTSLQLSKRGGGVALCLTNLREAGAPIKKIENQSAGVIPVMKLLEDSFSYANQLGQRQGAGAVYLSIHHPDIIHFLDTKRENADEKIRIKSLSLGLVVTDIAFQLAKDNKDIALFSPYDIERIYKKPMSDISITDEYDKLLNNKEIRKTYISARKLFLTIAELHFESGYPYMLFEDTVNKNNAHKKKGRIVMSNLCSEITQVSTMSEYNEDLSFKKLGEDICCNLGSLNIAKMMESGDQFGNAVEQSVIALDWVSRTSGLNSAPSIENGNKNNHAIGLGAMNLHGFLATNEIFYESKEAVDFTNMFFYTVAFHAFKASNNLAKQHGKFKDFDISEFSNGKWFDKYTKCDSNKWNFEFEKVSEIFKKYKVKIPSQKDWINLVSDIKKYGLANSHLMAVAPTGSISYVSSCTPSLQPVVAPVEVRKEGKLGRVYVPAYKIDFNNKKYYSIGGYEMGPEPIIDIVAAAQQHVDQAISLTLFMTEKATTRDLNKAYVYAFKKGCYSIYYIRIRQDVLENSENYECDTCVV